jgi:cation:H+ antiporter
MVMLTTGLVLSGSILLIFIAAVIFVNSIEWLGYRFKLSGSFVGAILAPLFTSFPELIVFLVALFGTQSGNGESIGIGTLFGQPFMASSLSYGLVGMAVLISFIIKKRKEKILRVQKSLSIPYIFITILFPLTVVPSFIPGQASKIVFGIIFLLAFLFYGFLMFRRKNEEHKEEEVEFSYIGRLLPSNPHFQLSAAFTQLVVAVGLLYFGSEKMVNAVSSISESINVSPLGLALIIVPAATAIPETISALIWAFRGKDTLAMGALVGEKVLFSTFYPGLGLLMTSWSLDKHAYWSVVATTLISLVLLYFILKGRISWYTLLFGLVSFVAYTVLVFTIRF